MDTLLAQLLDPLTVDAFFAEVWGASLHHVERCKPGYFDGLLPGLSTLDGILEHVRADPTAVRSVRGPEHKKSGWYKLDTGGLDITGAHRDLADGYTIVVDRLERYARSVTSLSHTLEVQLNFPVQVNAYISPPAATGFLPHYDHHDVLILQTQGAKVWHLHGDSAVPPHEMQRCQEFYPDALPPPSDSPTDVRLSVGDTLYVPRGLVHSAETTTQPSIHLTVGLHVPTALTLLSHTLHRLSLNDDRIHARLPPRHLDDPETRAGLAEILREALHMVQTPNAIDSGLSAMENLLVRRGRCPPVGQVTDVTGIDAQTRVVRYRPLYSQVMVVDGSVALQFAQFTVNLAPDHEAALRFVARAPGPFQIGALPGLTAAQQTDLAKTLILSGFLVRL